MLVLDHIAVAALDLADGVAHTERALGVTIPPGGAHPLMATHNHLLRLDGEVYLEVIAPDPAATAQRRRWFGLDDPAARAGLATGPRLATWIVSTPDIDAALSAIPLARGPAIPVTRGTLSWRIGVPEDGSMGFDGAFPTLIEWPPGPHVTTRMEDKGCALVRLEVAHPRAAEIAAALTPHLADPRIVYVTAPTVRLTAEIRTPAGVRRLG